MRHEIAQHAAAARSRSSSCAARIWRRHGSPRANARRCGASVPIAPSSSMRLARCQLAIWWKLKSTMVGRPLLSAASQHGARVGERSGHRLFGEHRLAGAAARRRRFRPARRAAPRSRRRRYPCPRPARASRHRAFGDAGLARARSRVRAASLPASATTLQRASARKAGSSTVQSVVGADDAEAQIQPCSASRLLARPAPAPLSPARRRAGRAADRWSRRRRSTSADSSAAISAPGSGSSRACARTSAPAPRRCASRAGAL